jgi:uncharacterized protein (DUF1330 family)
MTAYMVVEVRVKDQNKYDQYLACVPDIVRSYGGKYLVRGGEITSVIGSWNPQRMTILEFPSKESIDDWLASAEYKAITHLRDEGADVRSVILEGRSPKG